ncbi:MAG: ABC transporter ATP-binding protein/permease [Chloroflexota bacterium]|nr:ABC transporter ATP-binding protein/permease [Chloroflexota bacterium]
MAVTLRILRYLLPYWRRVVLLYIALFASLGLQLTIPMVIARAIDDGIGERDSRFLIESALLIVGLTLLQGIFTFARSYLVQSAAERVAYDMRNELYAHLQRLTYAFYDQSQTGQLMSRATEDINNIRAMLVMAMRPLVLAVATLIAVTIILLRIDLLLAVVALSIMPFLIWYSVRFGVAIRPMFLKVQEQFGSMTSALQENVAGSRVVRAFAQEQAESDRFEAELEELFERNLRAARRWAFAFPLTLLLSGVGLAAVLWLGGYQVLTGAISVGTLVAFNRYLTLLNDPVRWLGLVVNRIARAIASGERIFGTLDTKPKIEDRPDAIELTKARGEVRFDDVSFAFAGTRRTALENVSFTAEPGQIVALVGPTGAGKSAIVNLIPRFYDARSGRVLVDGHDAGDLTLDSLRRQIAIVPQETFLFSVSIRENIAYGRPAASQAEIEAAAKAAQAHEFVAALPEGYETEVGERGVSLSGGQKQRLAIARALLLDPPILILDDATASVDTETEEAIRRALRTVMAGRTSFVVAQRLTTVQAADQILVLEAGRIVERGTHRELLARAGFYRDLYDLQLRAQEEAVSAASSPSLASGGARP